MATDRLLKRRVLEKTAFAKGDFKTFEEDAILRAYAARILQNDYKMASALELVDEFPAIEKIKNELSRGHLEEASKILSSMKPKSDESDDFAEMKLEAARLANYEGNFDQCIKEATECINISLSGPTKIAAYQVRANAFLETGSFERCQGDLENVFLLAKLYPFSPVIFYAETLRIRMWARTRTPEFASEKLESLFHYRKKTGQLNLDTLLTYIRVRIDILRLSNRDFYYEAIVSYLLADAVGDELYSGLAILDIWSALNSVQRNQFTPLLERSQKKFRKIEMFMMEIKNDSRSKYLTSLGIQNYVSSDRSLPDQQDSQLVTDGHYDCIFIQHLSLWVHLKKQKIHFMSLRPQITGAVKILTRGPITKENFYKKMWASGEFHSLNHDTLIRTLLTRIRTETRLRIESKNGEILLEDKVLIV